MSNINLKHLKYFLLIIFAFAAISIFIRLINFYTILLFILLIITLYNLDKKLFKKIVYKIIFKDKNNRLLFKNKLCCERKPSRY